MKPDAGNVLSKAELMVRRGLIIFIFLFASIEVFSQNDIPVGTWRTHNSYNSLIAITQGNDQVFAATKNAYFVYDLRSKDITTVTSMTGLNDSDITTISYNPNANKLIVAYRNGNIDIIDNNEIIGFRYLIDANIDGSKEVHHIYHNGNLSYLSTDFGLMIIDLDKILVMDTYFELGPTGEKITVYSSCISSDSLYIATEAGVLRGSLNDNLKDFNNWEQFDLSNGLPVTETRIILNTPTGLITAIDNSGLFEYDGVSWQNLNLLTDSQFMHSSQNGAVSAIITTENIYTYEGGDLTLINSTKSKLPIGAVINNYGIYIADQKNGLEVNNDMVNYTLYPNGPFSSDIVNLYFGNKSIYAFPPAYNSSYLPLRNHSGFFVYHEGEWENYNDSGLEYTEDIPEFYDITGAVYSQTDDALYLSSMGYGIMKMDGESFSIYNENNSSLNNLIPPGPNIYISAICEQGGEITAVNYSSNEALHQYEISTNSWQAISPGLDAPDALQILKAGDIYWLRIADISGGGLMVVDHDGNNSLLLDDEPDTGNLPDKYVNDLALDLEGKMWVATKKGVVYYAYAQGILQDLAPDPVYPIYKNNILFKNENITALAIDGGNRIWMAASSGLWLFDDDGRTEILHFNTENSPLPSNYIIDIEINHDTGEVFITTDNGLVSYRGTSTMAGKKEEVKIFPNPVIISQHDIVTIEGLAVNVDVWITDASGKLIFKTKANGNTAVWQGLSATASISSGIYYVFASDKDGVNQQVGKIAIIE
ncbi:MAG: T9SS type A sorting domain-containing protein [Bacteroidota bacterium]